MAAPFVASPEMNGIETSFDRLSIASEDSSFGGRLENDSIEDAFAKEWGLKLSQLFKLSVQFYKEKDGKALHLSYEDKLKLVAYTQQVAHGPFNPTMWPPLGYLDVIGKDRRQAWQGIGEISKEDAMKAFVKLLETKCPQLRPYIEAHKRDLEEKEQRRKALEDEKRAEEERQKMEEEERRKEEEEQEKQEIQKRQIKEALNQQTYHQFKSYAEQQYPGNPEQQGVLIRQLQEEHYEKYMAQLYQQQQMMVCHQQQQQDALVNGDCDAHSDEGENQLDTSSGDEEDDEDMPQVSQATIWTRKDITDFKESIRKEGGDSIIKVGHGETVTVRVPTHADGTFLFWEFATDSYDIGFGLFFEWSQSTTTQVSVHISDSEDDLEEEEELEGLAEDVERGGSLKQSDSSDRPTCSVIVPVYRRDCHEEVYAGSHHYPGQGVYLLKFDNSYSLWRSKTLYYRVYYTR